MGDDTFGNWSEDWIAFLVGSTFATATIILVVAFYIVMARKALTS